MTENFTEARDEVL